jgi:hypothetical protein
MRASSLCMQAAGMWLFTRIFNAKRGMCVTQPCQPLIRLTAVCAELAAAGITWRSESACFGAGEASAVLLLVQEVVAIE